jgi:hypothetical protein
MGAAESKERLLTVDAYPIKLTVDQGVQLFGLFSNKRTLTWGDVSDSAITFRQCVSARIDPAKLYRMQKDLGEWLRHGKVRLDDFKDLAPWRPNPFTHFNAHVGDLIVKRHLFSSEALSLGGVTFEALWERHGLTPELMAMIKFTPEEWADLGLRTEHLEQFNDAQWEAVFGQLTRKDLVQMIREV